MAKIEANNAIGAIKGIFGLGIENAAGYGAKTTFLGKTGSSLTSGLEFGSNLWQEKDLSKAFVKTYGQDDKFQMGKFAGGVIGTYTGLRFGMGALRGTLTDGQGNLDIPGIPFI